MRKSVSTLMFSPFMSNAMAHEGHGLLGMHWHAGDVLGFIVFAALIGMLVWHFKK